MVDNIKQSKNLKDYVTIGFSSLKKYTMESSRPPPLVPLTLSLQYHRHSLIKVSKSLVLSCTPPIPKTCCYGAIEMEV